ncbi:MAG: OmpA family protein [Prochloraceae cyanobacterium]|nr:OmpA family protein [Prochloraceae cyanobacterium]
MKNTSINSIGFKLFSICILAILPFGCGIETEETQQPVSEKTEILTPNGQITEEEEKNSNLVVEKAEDLNTEIPQEEKNNNLVVEKAEDPIQNIVLEQPAQQPLEIESIIYFDFDRADLKEEAKVKLRQVSQKLLNSDRQITIEGHADERGTHEYNMDLGHRRARAVREFLATQGVDRAKLSTISHGETKPIAKGSHPEAWSQNRRVNFTIAEPTQANQSR